MPDPTEPRLLNMGAGLQQPQAPWVNADPDPQWAATWIVDPLDGLPWEDDWFDGAVAHHVLQMIGWVDLVPWLRELRRVTAGPVRLSVPDIAEAITAYHGGDRNWFPISEEHESSLAGAFCMYVTQAGATRSIFTSGYLFELLSRAGFGDVRTEHYGVCEWLPPLAALDSRPHESLIVTAR